MKQSRVQRLADGDYWATCKEQTLIEAVCNGHSQVFPQCRLTVRDGWAKFYRDGEEVWVCNAIYAKFNFQIQPA